MAPAVLRPSPFDSQLKKLGGSTPINVLTVCGDSLRRSSHPESARPDETDRALLALSIAEVAQGVGGVAPNLQAELQRAGAESFEAAFADSGEERALFAESSRGALVARDRAESVLVAARRRIELAKDDLSELSRQVAALAERLVVVDAKQKSLARNLTGINPERRNELATLDAGAKARAWWFSLMAEPEHDGMLRSFGDLEAGRPSDLALRDDSALRRVNLGGADPVELARLERRAARDPSLARSLEVSRSVDVEAPEVG
jgi:hypothetical protein